MHNLVVLFRDLTPAVATKRITETRSSARPSTDFNIATAFSLSSVQPKADVYGPTHPAVITRTQRLVPVEKQNRFRGLARVSQSRTLQPKLLGLTATDAN